MNYTTQLGRPDGVLDGVPRFEVLAAEAHSFAYRHNHKEIVDYLREQLGRPVVARLTGTADANNVTRWANGTAKPEAAKFHKMRAAAQIHFMLKQIFGSDESAGDWFTGYNTALDGQLPVDLIRDGSIDRVFSAVRLLAHM